MQVPKLSRVLAVCAPLCFWLDTATAKSDCQCIDGFDPDTMPKMNVTSFSAIAYPNGSSMQVDLRPGSWHVKQTLTRFSYSFDLNFWPGADLASCGTIVQGRPGVFASIWGDAYCWKKVDGSFVPVYWYWNQSWPETDYELRIDSKYLVTANSCYECVETGVHIVSTNDLDRRSMQSVVYRGRQSFALRPTTTHG